MGKIPLSSFQIISKQIENACYCKNDEKVTSNIYLFRHEDKTLIIDSGDGSGSLPFTPDACFLTHGHFDHTGGVEKDWKEVFIHPLEGKSLPFIKIPANSKSPLLTAFDFGIFHFEILHTPGHTPGSMCLFETNHSLLLSGDTLFAGGVHGRTDIGGPDAEANMRESLEILSRIDWKILCPGHGGLEFA